MPPGIYRLPLELVRKVAAESSSRDLAALALTSRHFHAWVHPCLYEHNIKHEEADAAVWAASHGRLDTLLLLHRAKIRPPKSFINKVWFGRAFYGLPLLLQRRPQQPPTFTLLHLAVQGGHDDVVSWLLQQGADVDAHSANLCDCYLRRTVSPSWTPLHLALCHSQEKTVKLLLSHNASLQARKTYKIEALHTAAAKGLPSTILHLSTRPDFDVDVKDCWDITPLHHAVMASKSLDVIKTLLDLGADVQGLCHNMRRPPYTPLWYAISQGNLQVAVMLLQAGAKPFPRKLRRHEHESRTPLLQAILRNKITTGNRGRHGVLQRKVIRELLDYGCDINEKFMGCGEGRTPLILAVRNSYPATVRLLLERGAEVNANDIGSSALWYALSERASASLTERVDKVTALLEHGANLLDSDVITELIIRRSSRAVMDAVADNLGPENLTDSNEIPRVLAICCIFQERKIHDSIKRYAQAKARATDGDIRYALEQSAHQKRASVPAFLDEMRPGLTVDGLLVQWRDKMSFSLVEWLEEIKRLEGGE